MADEILALVNHNNKLLCWLPTSLYSGYSDVTPTALWQIGKPVYPKLCGGANTKLMAFGRYTGTTPYVYTVKISDPTHFQVSVDGGVIWTAAALIQSALPTALGAGVYLQFYTDTYTTNDTWTFTVYPAWFLQGPTYTRWAIARWRNGYFFSNLFNEVLFTDGDSVQSLVPNCQSAPKAKYLEIFHEHLVAANVNFNGVAYPNVVMWSDIHDMSKYTSDLTNEADNFDLNIDESFREISFGLTGIKQLGAYLMVYAPKEIFRIKYVGLPLVMVKETFYSEIGNAFPWALVGNNKFHCFISDENFYFIEGENSPVPMGDEIKDYFFNDLSTNPEYRYRVHGYYNRAQQEIEWIYCSKSSVGDFDKKVVWNYRERLWYISVTENVHSYIEASVQAGGTPIESNTNIINTVSTIIEQSGTGATTEMIVLYGTKDRQLLRDELSTDLLADLLPAAEPMLETKDLYYNNLETIKSIDSMVIHATYDSTSCKGIEVQYSARYHLDDVLNWQVVPTLWTPLLKEKRLSLPRIAGRIFRFKFTFKEKIVGQGVRGAIFTAWGENVYGLPIPQPDRAAER